MDLPNEFIEQIYKIYPGIAKDILKTFYIPQKTSFRINSLKSSKKEVLEYLKRANVPVEKVEWHDMAFVVKPKHREILTKSTLFKSGKIYIQNLSSMLASIILEAKPNERVLDLAAAPGGKSIMIASMMKNSGLLSAVEPKKERFFRLKSNIKNSGATNIKLYMSDGRSIGKKCPDMFDRVLLDAPCTTEAKFKAYDKKSFSYWSKRKIKEMSKLQYRLLISAIKSLKPGGVLVYSTCSFEPQENELVIDKVLKKFDNLKVIPIDSLVKNSLSGFTYWDAKQLDRSLLKTVRIVPNEYMEGFFIAKLTKL